LFFSVSL